MKTRNTKKAFLKIIIDDIPPSNNRFMGNQRAYQVYNKAKKDWKRLVWRSLPSELPQKPIQRAEVSIHYIFPDKRKRDLDNYSGKFLLDPLVEKSVLEDDCYQVLTNLNLSAECRPKIRKTIIEVRELEQQ